MFQSSAIIISAILCWIVLIMMMGLSFTSALAILHTTIQNFRPSPQLSHRDITIRLKKLINEENMPEVWKTLGTENVNTYNTVTLMYDIARLNKKRQRFGISHVKVGQEELDLLSCALEKCRRKAVKGVDVGMGLYGLQIFTTPEGDIALRRLVIALESKAKLCKQPLSAKEIGMSLYGLKDLSSSTTEVKSLLREVTIKIKTCESLDSQAIGNCLYGLQSMSGAEEEVMCVVHALTEKIREVPQLALGAQNVGNSLYGLQGMHEVGGLLDALYPLIARCKDCLNPQEISNALYGLQGLSSSDQSVCKILNILATHMERCTEVFKSQEISNSFYGLQRMNSADPEVRRIVYLLGKKLKSSNETLGSQSVCAIFSGMRGLSSVHAEVCDLLPVLNSKLRQCGELDSVAMSAVLCGMHRMGNHNRHVQELTGIMAGKLSVSKQAFDSQAVGNSMYGISNFDSSQGTEVMQLVAALREKIESCVEVLDAQEMGSALLGLKGLRNEGGGEEVRGLIVALTEKLSHCLVLDAQAIGNSFYGLQSLDASDSVVVSLIELLHARLVSCEEPLTLQQMGTAIYGLLDMPFTISIVAQTFVYLLNQVDAIVRGDLSKYDLEQIHTLLQVLTLAPVVMQGIPTPILSTIANAQASLLESFQSRLASTSGFKSKVEESAANVVKSLLCEHTDFEMVTNSYISGFETDIIIQNKVGQQNRRVLNIEVDGPTHLFKATRKFCQLRDQFLSTKKGIRIYRVVAIETEQGRNELLAEIKSFCAEI